MSIDTEGYGPRPSQTDIDRLLEDSRTLSPLGIERAADGWARHAGSGEHTAWREAERAALHTLETNGRTGAWDELRNRLLGLTESEGALVSWRFEHGDVGHNAERALLGAALALMAQPELDRNHAKTLLAPMGEALPWLTTNP